jgi:hypothetical protein
MESRLDSSLSREIFFLRDQDCFSVFAVWRFFPANDDCKSSQTSLSARIAPSVARSIEEAKLDLSAFS